MKSLIINEKEPKIEISTSQAAAALGRKGGTGKSEAKPKASRENGKKGGRPRKVQ